MIIGKADRVEKSPDGKYLIADFKTGKATGYIDNDFASCIQTLLYAYMLNKNGINIEKCEYRFVKVNRLVKCAYTSGFESQIDSLFDEIAASVSSNRFECTEDKNKCKYCEYKAICGREEL